MGPTMLHELVRLLASVYSVLVDASDYRRRFLVLSRSCPSRWDRFGTLSDSRRLPSRLRSVCCISHASRLV